MDLDFDNLMSDLDTVIFERAGKLARRTRRIETGMDEHREQRKANRDFRSAQLHVGEKKAGGK